MVARPRRVRARRRQGRLSRFVRSHVGRCGHERRVGQVGGGVDVERQPRVGAHLETAARRHRRGDVTAERAAAVRRGELDPDGHGDDVRAVAAAVGHDDDGARDGERRRGRRPAAGRVGDHDVVEALAGDHRAAGVDGAVETEPRAPQHLGAVLVGPRRDLVVVAGDERRQLTGRGDDPPGEPAGEVGASEAVEHDGQAALGRGEAP